MHPLESYLQEIGAIRQSGGGVKETSYYGPLAALLSEAGRGLRRKVRCIINLRNSGAGIPGGGLFTQDQFPKASADAPLEGAIPSRGAIEVKGLHEEVLDIAASEQVARYVERYGQVLVTNLRDFVLVGRDEEGRATPLESFRIAPTHADFLVSLAHPRKGATERGARRRVNRALARPSRTNVPICHGQLWRAWSGRGPGRGPDPAMSGPPGPPEIARGIALMCAS